MMMDYGHDISPRRRRSAAVAPATRTPTSSTPASSPLLRPAALLVAALVGLAAYGVAPSAAPDVGVTGSVSQAAR